MSQSVVRINGFGIGAKEVGQARHKLCGEWGELIEAWGCIKMRREESEDDPVVVDLLEVGCEELNGGVIGQINVVGDDDVAHKIKINAQIIIKL